MPQLKQLSCCIQWSDTGVPFQEHGALYGDGVVETFIIIPNKPQGFSIRLTSRSFISEGLVMIVFIDGNYQCNRSRVNLLPPAKDRPTNRAEIDFLLRQKEKSQGDGIYLGREWRFDNHNIVAESPAGFQESHFDDLGVIEVLVLRCRARNREDAEYEGSSSGEDSDVFGDRPLVEDQDPEIVSASVVPEPSAEEEDGGLGFMGFMDGANDPPNPPHCDGSNDASGRWIWHQSQPPFPGVPEPPQYHQPEGHRFRAQSFAQLPIIHHPQPFHDRRSRSGQQKRVHFDYGHPGPAQPPQPQPPSPPSQQQDTHMRSSQVHQPQPQRPASRVRERWPSNGSQTYPTQSYDPQRIDRLSHATEWHDAPENHDSHPSKSPPPSDRAYAWSYGNGNAQRNNDARASHIGRSRNNDQFQQSQNQGKPTGQQPEQRQSFGSKQNGSESAPAENSRTPPTNTANHDTSRQNMRYNAQTFSPRSPLAHNRRPSHPEPAYHASRPEYLQHRVPSNEMPGYPISSPYAPAFPHYSCPYPHLSQMQHGFNYAQVPHPGYWPGPVAHAYDPNYAGMYPGRQANVFLHPHMNASGSTEHRSPTDTYGNNGGYSGSNDSPNNTGHGQEGSGGQQDVGGNSDVNQNWKNDSTNNDNGNNNTTSGNWNGDQNDNVDAEEKKEGDSSWGNNDNSGNVDDDHSNGNWGHGDSGNDNNNNDTWKNADNDGNNNTWNYENKDTQLANIGNGWDTSAGKNSGNGAGENAQSPTVSAGVSSDVPRDLYGPHGPYYALRGLRISEPRPDAEEEPRFDVPKALAVARRSTKQVQPGPGYRYYKKRTIPEYIDSLDNPYARFVFKYRTKDQLLDEIGIEVDVEPTGDAEIQDLQNLDKQALIEMLIRAKSALGGKVPSPPPTPSTQGSEVNAPVAIDAPKHAYLKYSLPPLRPNHVNSAKPSSSGAKPKPKPHESASKKENDSGWNSQNRNDGGDGWGHTWNNNTTNTGDWGDGSSAKGSKHSAKNSKSSVQSSQQVKASGSWESKIPPRPVSPAKDPAENNWGQATATSNAPAGGW